jgi:hypothetical protein
MLLEYLGIFVFCILLIYLVLCAYIKIKFQFWSMQPVFHIYDFMYWIKPPGRINHDVPAINKYVNLVDIKTLNVNEIDDTTTTHVCNFIKTYYLQNKNTKYLPTKSNIMSYLECSNYPSYISIYRKPKMLFDKKNLDFNVLQTSSSNEKDDSTPITYIDEYISVISARVLHITLKGLKTFPLYYIDNLCVHSDHRNKGIAPETIATLYYNLSRLERNVCTYLFKREGDLNAIVPLTTYLTYGYDISQFYFMSFPIGSVSLIEITKKNISLFTHFIHQYNKFECIILPDISSIDNLIKTENFYIYGIIQNKELIAVYIFKKQSLWFEENNATATNATATNDNNTNNNKYQTIDCIASLYIEGLSSDIFIIGFNQALHQINKRDNKIKRIMIENTSHNATIIEYAQRINIQTICKYPSAFFLYNYGCYSYQPWECFFIY